MHMSSFLTKWTLNDIPNIIGVFFGFVSILLAVYFYLRSKKTKILLYAQRSYRIITNRFSTIEGIQVSLFGEPVETVTLTRIALWNAGNDTIRDDDIPGLDQVRIVPTANSKIHKLSIIEMSNESNNMRINEVKAPTTQWQVRFEYMDPGEGMVLEIVHDGTENSSFKVEGKLKGGKLRRSLTTKEEDQNPVPVAGGMATVPSFTPGFFRFAGYFLACFMSPLALILGYFFDNKVIIPGLAVMAFGILVIILSRFFYPKFKLKRFEYFDSV